MSERCERTSEQKSEWPSTRVDFYQTCIVCPCFRIAGVGALAAIAYLASQSGYKEISYKDFTNTYLMDKSVERLEVVNKKWVKVKLANRQVRATAHSGFKLYEIDAFIP